MEQKAKCEDIHEPRPKYHWSDGMTRLKLFELPKSGVGNLSLAAGQKQTRQSPTGRTNFPPTIPLPSLLKMLLKLWNLNQIDSWFSQKAHS